MGTDHSTHLDTEHEQLLLPLTPLTAAFQQRSELQDGHSSRAAATTAAKGATAAVARTAELFLVAGAGEAEGLAAASLLAGASLLAVALLAFLGDSAMMVCIRHTQDGTGGQGDAISYSLIRRQHTKQAGGVAKLPDNCTAIGSRVTVAGCTAGGRAH